MLSLGTKSLGKLTLLDWFAADLIDFGYDIKHLMSFIICFRAYQIFKHCHDVCTDKDKKNICVCKWNVLYTDPDKGSPLIDYGFHFDIAPIYYIVN